MDSDKVIRLDITATHSCQPREKTWDEVLQELHSVRVQIMWVAYGAAPFVI